MITIDEIAYNSPFRDWSPLGKFVLALSLLISSLVASSIVIPLLCFAIGFALLFYSTRLRFPRVIVIALLEGLLIFLLGAIVIALVTAGDPLWSIDIGIVQLTFSQQGVQLGAMVFLRALAGVTVMLFFATSTPLPQFANALRQVGIPKEFVELTVLIYRYSFLLLEQMGTMYVAANCRLGFQGYRNKYRTTAKLAVGVFTRSLDMADRSQVALDCRGYQGEFHSYRPPAKLSASWVSLSIAVFAGLFSINMLIADPVAFTTLFSL